MLSVRPGVAAHHDLLNFQAERFAGASLGRRAASGGTQETCRRPPGEKGQGDQRRHLGHWLAALVVNTTRRYGNTKLAWWASLLLIGWDERLDFFGV